MEKGLSLNQTMIRKALATPGLKLVMGTDSNAEARARTRRFFRPYGKIAVASFE